MIYEFYIESMLIQADKCEKDEYNFLHLYRKNIHIANIYLGTYSISYMTKSDNSITFELKKERK
ncbi:MAG: hypothetical protein SOY42_12835 [Clostridium sp.]|nr:hypothetical protein [Clostridium sp.]